MKTRYGVSAWVDTHPASRRPNYPRLRGEHIAQVVIIGGGLTGCATAYACAAAGLRPLVIEADRIGQGASGRSAGLFLSEPGPLFRDVVDAHGMRAARRVFETWRRASLDAASQVRRLAKECRLETRDTLLVVSGDEKAWRREHDARAAAGLHSVWLTPTQVKAAAALESSGAMRLGEGFVLNPYRASLGVASAAVKRGASVFEHTRVKKVRFTRKDVEVVLENGVVRANTAIVTTGTATEEFKPLRRHFKRRETYLTLSEPVPASVRKAVGNPSTMLSDGSSYRLCWTRDGRMLITGGDQDETPARRRDAVLVQRTGQLMYQALTMYPGISGLQPEYGWDAPYGETADRLMYIGPHRNYPHHLFALGGSGDSLTGAFLAARILARAARGAPEKADELFGWNR